MVKPGGSLSLQKHRHRAEHWVVVHGIAEVTVDESVGRYCVDLADQASSLMYAGTLVNPIAAHR